MAAFLISRGRSRLATICLSILALTPRGAGGQDIERRIDSLFASYNASPSPGVAVAVVRDGAVVFSKGYGLADIEHRVPIGTSTVFDMASVAKQFAGLSVAMLVGQGKIGLADDVRKYIPEVGDLGHPVTIDHLVHHTSGLRDWPGALALAGWRMDDVISYDQILRMAYRQRSLNFTPGSQYTYSNTGYNLLAETVARVTGQPFRVWTDENLFKPLGMTSTVFRDDHTSIVPNRALGYARQGDGSFRSIPDNLTALGSSSLFSTVSDMAKWVINFDDAKVGGRAAMELSRTRGTLNSGATNQYAFGVIHGTYRGLPMVNHSGSWAQFSTFVLHFPAQRVGVIVLANSSSINTGRAAYNLSDIYLSKELAAAPVATASAAPTATSTPTSVPTRILDEYAGVYRLGPGWYARIARDGNGLTTQATNESAFPMTARSDREFWVEAYGASMTFERNAAGEVTGLAYRAIRAPRLAMPSANATPAGLAEFAGTYESAELGTSYSVESKGDSLTISHFRHGTFPLTWTWNEFSSPAWFLKSVAFERDSTGRVTGFVVNIDERNRNIRFTQR